jgi:hypothetical protein
MMKLSIREEGVTVPPQSVIADPRVEIWRDTAGAVYAYGERHGEECWMHVPGVASYRFTQQGDEVAATVAYGARAELVLDAYRRRVLPMAVQVRGGEVLHASAVRSSMGVVGLCGVTQTGKSTIAFALSQRGYDIWCDDALAFDASNGRSMAISLPFELRLRPAAAALFGQATITETPAAELNTPRSDTAPFAAVCVLRREDDRLTPVSVRRLEFSSAFLAVLAHACWFTMQDADEKRRVIEHYIDLVAETPVFDVSFKSGLEHLPSVLDAIEAALDGAACQP